MQVMLTLRIFQVNILENWDDLIVISYWYNGVISIWLQISAASFLFFAEN